MAWPNSKPPVFTPPGFAAPPKAAPASGLEIMLRQLGLAEVIDMAKSMATEGTITRILAFADGVDALNARLERMEAKLDVLSARGGTVIGASDPAAIARFGDLQPGSRGTDGGPVGAIVGNSAHDPGSTDS